MPTFPSYPRPASKVPWGTTGDLNPPSDGERTAGFPADATVGHGLLNSLLNEPAAAVRYLLQRGIPSWAADDSFYVGAVVRDPTDQQIYEAFAAPTDGVAPSTDTAHWRLFVVPAGEERNLVASWPGSVTWDGTNATFKSVVVSKATTGFQYTITNQTVVPGGNNHAIGFYTFNRTMSADVPLTVGGVDTDHSGALVTLAFGVATTANFFCAIALVNELGQLVLRNGVVINPGNVWSVDDAYGLFGDGSDGDLHVLNGQTVTVTKAVKQYNNLTVDAGGTLILRQSPVFVNDTMTVNGQIHADGASATSGAAGVGSDDGTSAPIGGGTSGGTGAPDGVADTGSNGFGTAGTAFTGAAAGRSAKGGAGGGGGPNSSGTLGYIGANPGDSAGPSTNKIALTAAQFRQNQMAIFGIVAGASAVTMLRGGTGGGGGGAGKALTGGGNLAGGGNAGAGGDFILIMARRVSLSAGTSVRAIGGAGSAGKNAPLSSGGGGGGGGPGGGGRVHLGYQTTLGTPLDTVACVQPGAPGAAGADGASVIGGVHSTAGASGEVGVALFLKVA